MLNTFLLTLPLCLGLAYAAISKVEIPMSIVIPTIGGGLMNLGFWLFYDRTIGPIPELSKSIFGRSRTGFLLVSILHLVAIFILLTFDISWILRMLP
jgi:hypothetical protein